MIDLVLLVLDQAENLVVRVLRCDSIDLKDSAGIHHHLDAVRHPMPQGLVTEVILLVFWHMTPRSGSDSERRKIITL
jgi:hypothetical protein